MDGVCIPNNDIEGTNTFEDFQTAAESACHDENDICVKHGTVSDEDCGPETVHLMTESPRNVFVELPASNEGTDRSADLSDSDDSIIFCSEPEAGSLSLSVEKPTDILTEVSDILMSLSDDQRFIECVNFPNSKNPILNGELDKHTSSVDLIFTYNILGVLYNKLRELKTYFELLKSENNKFVLHSHDDIHYGIDLRASSLF